MGLNNFFEEDEVQASVDLSPLIDMVFLLLLYFMVATTMDRTEAIKVEKAEAQTATALDEDKFRIVLDSTGKAWLGTDLVPVEEALRESILWHNQNPEGVILIIPDKRAPMEPFIQIMDGLKAQGVRNMAIGTQPGHR